MVELSEGPVQRGNGNGGPTTPKPVILPKGQASARAALAGQQGEGPSDIPPGPFSEHELREQWNQQADEFNQWDSLDSCEQLAWAQARAIQRDRNARPTPPAEGEVAELVDRLRRASDGASAMGWEQDSWAIARAAELLQQQQAKIESLEQQLETERMRVVACGIIATSDTPFSAAKNRNCHPDYWSASADDIARQIDELMRLRAQQTPVPVSEGLPGAADIHFEFVVSDADYCTQAGGVAPTYAQALSEGQRYLAQYQQDGPHTLELRRVEVLHPGALPLPQGEVEG